MSFSSHSLNMTYQRSRDRMVATLMAMGITHPRVLEVMRSTPRHLFVDEALAYRGYENTALPIGFGQTISQPYIVAKMTETLLQREPLDTVLEVGTGSGYQAAILAQLVGKVYSVERIRQLQRQAREIICSLGLNNVSLRYSDGHLGLPDCAPFDAIMVTAAARQIPPELLMQLKEGGCLIAPVEEEPKKQRLVCVIRHGDVFAKQWLDGVLFVPLIPGDLA